MSGSENIKVRRDEEEQESPSSSVMPDRVYDNFRRDFMWAFRSFAMIGRDWEFPLSLFDSRDFRIALCDLVDSREKYELHVEVPGIERERIDIKATKHSVEISDKKTEKTEERRQKAMRTMKGRTGHFTGEFQFLKR